MQSSIF